MQYEHGDQHFWLIQIHIIEHRLVYIVIKQFSESFNLELPKDVVSSDYMTGKILSTPVIFLK